MNNPLLSSEIRWFSQDKFYLYSLYEKLPGLGKKESDRTDYYLKYQGMDTGVKIREGKHEIKVINANRELIQNGVIEHWSKWSTIEDKNILNTISSDHMSQWVPIKKERWKKKYVWNIASAQMEYTELDKVEDGCGVEYTIIQVQGKIWYTFGLEAFGTKRSSSQNLLDTLEYLQIPRINIQVYPSLGYPTFLSRLICE